MSGDHNMNQKPLVKTYCGGKPNYVDEPNHSVNLGTYNQGVMAERQRIVNLLMIQHEMAKERHNYWQVAANLIQADGVKST
jgi:hypothetical protein